MKRTFIRFCGAAMAGFIGVMGKNQAFAACSVHAVSDTNEMTWITTGCSNSVVGTVCVGGKGRGTVWDAATGDYAGYCWCKNVSSNGLTGDIACVYNTGSYATKFKAISGVCSFASGYVSVTTTSKYYGVCASSTDACYYDSSTSCAKSFSTTGEVHTALANCCKPCVTGPGITGLTVDGMDYRGDWTVRGNGGVGIENCIYSAPSVTDTYGTFVAGGGGSYTCHAIASSGSGTGIGTPVGTGTGI